MTRELVIPGAQPRSAWGGSPTSPAAYAPLEGGIVVHWNGPPMGAYAPAQAASLVRNTWAFHTGPSRGWADIAYNFAVDRYGGIWTGRGDRRWNAASGTTEANYDLLAVECMCGVGDPFTPEMRGALQRIAAAYVQTGRAPLCYGHRHVTNTECPGNEILGFVAQLDAQMQAAAKGLNADFAPASYAPQLESPPNGKLNVEMLEYLIQNSVGTTYGVYADGKTRQLIYPELLYVQKYFNDHKKELIAVKSDNPENDQIIAHRAVLT